MFTLFDVANERTGDPNDPSVSVTNMDGGDFNPVHWDPGLMRPYRAENGKVYVDVTVAAKAKRDAEGNIVTNKQGDPIIQRVYQPQLVHKRLAEGLPVLNVNNATVLTKDQWIRLDSVITQASRKRLRAWADLRAAATLGGFDGMATPILEHEVVSDNGEAIVDMDGISEGRNFVPKYARQGTPLPITHSDFFMSDRFLAISRNRTGAAADVTRARMAGRRVGEMVENTLIGNVAGVTYGDSTDYLQTSKVYGYTNHPSRITKTDLPTAATVRTNIATTGGTSLLNAVMGMLDLASAQNFYGPFILYVSSSYDDLLDFDFKAESTGTIRARLMELDRIQDIRRLDYLTGDVMILVEMDSENVEAVNGLEITTVQWDTKGGFQKNFKVLCIQVPLIKARFINQTTNTVTGIVHGTTS